ncbi:MAG: hypothetical protein Q7T95_26515, partial [Hydrogenophaga sp.]|nr:hypothetical protein [Hydrogenophaga sp.]
MIYIFTKSGIVVVEGGAAAAAALREVGAQIVDDVARVASQADDAKDLLEIFKVSLAGNGLDATKVVGAVAFGGAAAAAITIGAIPLAGSAAIAIGIGWAAGELYEWAFDRATEIGQRAGQAAYEMWGSGIDPQLNTSFNAARNVVQQRDPLVLDLDGDGLELAPASSNLLFDHNADGIKTGTGWARPDDGFLVRDLNGNGLIDSGRELFGVDTVKRNGQFATQGFDALSDLDTNADGQITSADAAWSELQVWRDLNQDGITQAGELNSLTSLNITSIDLNGNAAGPQAGQTVNNNRVALSTTFTQSGETRTIGAIDLESNPFFSHIPAEQVDETGNPVTFTEAAAALPQMNGSGMVRNLRAAMSQAGA